MHISPASQRSTVDLLEREFDSAIDSLRKLTSLVPTELLYRQTRASSVGENILRSAGVLEQTFGGITSSLWDDPFEWTLPETLSTPVAVLNYLSEVDKSKALAFASFLSDDILLKLIAIPSGDPSTLFELLLKALSRAGDYRGRAVATLKILSDVSGAGFII